MKIRIIKDNILVGSHCYRINDIIDSEFSGERKKDLVDSKAAEWYTEPVETATINRSRDETAIKSKAKGK